MKYTGLKQTSSAKSYAFIIACIIVLQSSICYCQWNIIPSGTDKELFSVHFPTDSIGYIVGRESTILKTINGGSLWTPLETGISHGLFTSTYFINDSVGFITGTTYGTVLKTTNGGLSWSVKTLPTANDFYNIRFYNDSVGFIVGYREIWKTTDQGKNWTSQYGNQNLAFPVFYSLEFVSKDTIFIAGVDGETGRILKTVNGGGDWTSTSISKQMRFGVDFVNTKVGYTIGTNPDIYKTIDGGESWSLINNSPNMNINRAIHFVSETVGFIAGYDGKIFTTADEGVTWKTETTNTAENLYDLCFTKNSGFAVGPNGMILKLSMNENSECQKLTLYKGWNLISTYITPNDKRMSVIFENRNDVIVKNAEGTILFAPAFGIINGTWNIKEGYMVNAASYQTLNVCGKRIDPQATIPLVKRSYPIFLPYYYKTPLPVNAALQGLGKNYIFVQSMDSEHFPKVLNYIPSHIINPPINQIGSMKPGLAYKVILLNDVPDFKYP